MSSDVRLSKVRKMYGSTVAVNDVDLYIEHGSLVSLLGPSGCGKTTTLRMIAGLTTITSGEIYFGGHPVSRTPAHRRNVGMLFQSYALFPHMTVFGNVAFGLRMRDVRGTALERSVDAALEKVGLLPLKTRYPDELSGGQQQRVALARALVIEPAVLLLDEPLGALDRQLRQSMQVELKTLQRSLQITTIVVTHDQEEALLLSDRISVMNEGRVEQFGTPADVYQRPQSAFVARFLGTSNVLEGRVARLGETGVVVDAGGLPLTASTHSSNVRFSVGSRVLVAIRPQDIDISMSAPEHAGNVILARLHDKLFRGNETEYVFHDQKGRTLIASAANRAGGHTLSDLVCGTSCFLSFAPDATKLILA